MALFISKIFLAVCVLVITAMAANGFYFRNKNHRLYELNKKKNGDGAVDDQEINKLLKEIKFTKKLHFILFGILVICVAVVIAIEKK